METSDPHGFPVPNKRHKAAIRVGDIPHMAAPVAAYLHEISPDAVVAADRGARLFAVGVHAVWRQLYADEKFPTMDGKIHFGRWSKSLDKEEFRDLTTTTLERAGIFKNTTDHLGYPLEKTIVFLDDWSCYGRSIRRFKRTAESICISRGVLARVIAVTMCGSDQYADFVGDKSRQGHNASWNDNSRVHGISFKKDECTPVIRYPASARRVRRKLQKKVVRYVRDYELSK